MRPELEDFDELNEGTGSRSRAMSWLVLVVAVGGFVALAYYAYHSGSQSVRDGQVLVVKADTAPIKTSPDQAGGEQFPNQDKTIYDAIAAADDSDDKVEKLLPEAEQPVIPQPAVSQDATPPVAADKQASATTFVNKALQNDSPAVDPVDAKSMQQPAPAVAPEAKPVEKPAPVAKPAPVKTAPAKPVAKPTASGSYQVQLGAFKSEAEAKQQWAKISAKNSDVLSGGPIIVKADLPNGTFYRLRAGGFASVNAAKAACSKLAARKQACFYAGK